MEQSTEKRIIEARRRLCQLAERSGEERRTQAWIRAFLAEHSDLRVADMGSWLYAVHHEGADRTLVVRADHDAVPTAEGARHLCGHDGHTAALLGLGLLLKGQRLGKNVILLFQHAEETGAGAAECCALFALEGLDRDNAEIIGCHNIPGQPLGTVLLRRGAFACASCGVELRLKGRPAHAAYPENGLNPTAAAARLALELPALAARTAEEYGCMALATLVGMRTGARAFGVAASEGALWVTLRAESQAAFAALNARAEEAAAREAEAQGLSWELERFDVFPATENDPALLARLEAVCRAAGLPCRELEHPFRWSEDFGCYGKYLPACFFGLGAGTDTPPLHTAEYVYPDTLAPLGAELLLRLCREL